MSVQLAIANIALDTASVSRQGFGTLAFIGKHNYFKERARIYTSTQDMITDGFDTASGAYIAAQGAFSQTPRPTSIVIGRQETTSLFTPQDVAANVQYSITLEVDGTTATFAYTAIAADDAADICTVLKTAIEANAGISPKVSLSVVGSGSDGKLTISQVVSGTDWFVVSGLLNLVETPVELSTETAAETLAAILEVEDSFYYLMAQDKTTAFILALSAEVESRTMYYCTSTKDLGALASPATGVVASLLDSNVFRTNCKYSQDAETKYPEVNTIAEIAFAVTGAVTYANRIVAGVSESKNALDRPITATEQANLKKTNTDFFARVGKFPADPVITVLGKSVSGEYIDNIVGRDNLQADLQADVTDFMIRQKTSKVAFNNVGAAQLRSVMKAVFKDYTASGTHNFIEDDFEIIIPDQSQFKAADKATREFNQVTFKATLTNAIHMSVITGTLSL